MARRPDSVSLVSLEASSLELEAACVPSSSNLSVALRPLPSLCGASVFCLGVPPTIWANDMSMMTSAICALFVGSAVWLGWEAWRIGESTSDNRGRSDPHSFTIFTPSSDYGHLAERLCVMAGFFGTPIGLSLQAK